MNETRGGGVAKQHDEHWAKLLRRLVAPWQGILDPRLTRRIAHRVIFRSASRRFATPLTARETAPTMRSTSVTAAEGRLRHPFIV
jgi:hypothetical protein